MTAAALGLGSYLIARRALYPVAAMTATAREITHGDLRRRIEGARSQDELGHLASTLNAMIGRLNETVDRERRFTADASHELRTPLATIEASIDVTLAQERTPAEYRRVLRLVREQSQRLHRLAGQLLLLARLDADELRSGFAPMELRGLVEAVVESFCERHPQASVQFDGAAGPIEVSGDLELLARAVLNVLENAVAHVGPAVAVEISCHCHADGTTTVTIEDDGPGVADQVVPELFHRFRRGDTGARGGTGLGLAIVQAIMQGHGGAARLDPSPNGRGARFELTLPLRDS
jgi:signal transduction histidine kinase